MTGKKISSTKVFSENDLIKEILIWAFQIAVVLACAVVVAILFFQSVSMQEGSMEPTLAVGDRKPPAGRYPGIQNQHERGGQSAYQASDRASRGDHTDPGRADSHQWRNL